MSKRKILYKESKETVRALSYYNQTSTDSISSYLSKGNLVWLEKCIFFKKEIFSVGELSIISYILNMSAIDLGNLFNENPERVSILFKGSRTRKINNPFINSKIRDELLTKAYQKIIADTFVKDVDSFVSIEGINL